METPEPSESGYPEEQPAEVVPESDRERHGDGEDRSGTTTGAPPASRTTEEAVQRVARSASTAMSSRGGARQPAERLGHEVLDEPLAAGGPLRGQRRAQSSALDHSSAGARASVSPSV